MLSIARSCGLDFHAFACYPRGMTVRFAVFSCWRPVFGSAFNVGRTIRHCRLMADLSFSSFSLRDVCPFLRFHLTVPFRLSMRQWSRLAVMKAIGRCQGSNNGRDEEPCLKRKPLKSPPRLRMALRMRQRGSRELPARNRLLRVRAAPRSAIPPRSGVTESWSLGRRRVRTGLSCSRR